MSWYSKATDVSRQLVGQQWFQVAQVAVLVAIRWAERWALHAPALSNRQLPNCRPITRRWSCHRFPSSLRQRAGPPARARRKPTGTRVAEPLSHLWVPIRAHKPPEFAVKRLGTPSPVPAPRPPGTTWSVPAPGASPPRRAGCTSAQPLACHRSGARSSSPATLGCWRRRGAPTPADPPRKSGLHGLGPLCGHRGSPGATTSQAKTPADYKRGRVERQRPERAEPGAARSGRSGRAEFPRSAARWHCPTVHSRTADPSLAGGSAANSPPHAGIRPYRTVNPAVTSPPNPSCPTPPTPTTVLKPRNRVDLAAATHQSPACYLAVDGHETPAPAAQPQQMTLDHCPQRDNRPISVAEANVPLDRLRSMSGRLPSAPAGSGARRRARYVRS